MVPTNRLIAQAILFLLKNVKFEYPGPAMSELNHHIGNMERLLKSYLK